MIHSFYIGKSGAAAYAEGISVNANNLANVSTAGYKAQRARYSELAYTDLPGGDGQVGNGARLSGTSAPLRQGAVEETGNACDVAIEGDGFFCVLSRAGETYYTRAGSFKLQPTDGGYNLVTNAGDFVLNQSLNPVFIAEGGDLRIGRTSANPEDQDGTVRLALYAFDNPEGLAKDGGGRLFATEASGGGRTDETSRVRQGALESSDVDMVSEMSGLIRAQRGFQLSARMITTADELEQTINSLR